MGAFGIICIVMALLSGFFWVMEAQPVIRALKSVPTYGFWNKMLFPFRVLLCLRFIGPLALDILATSILVSGCYIGGITIGFQMGGVMGTAMGLTISNVISLAIWWNGRQSRKARLA